MDKLTDDELDEVSGGTEQICFPSAMCQPTSNPCQPIKQLLPKGINK